MFIRLQLRERKRRESNYYSIIEGGEYVNMMKKMI